MTNRLCFTKVFEWMNNRHLIHKLNLSTSLTFRIECGTSFPSPVSPPFGITKGSAFRPCIFVVRVNYLPCALNTPVRSLRIRWRQSQPQKDWQRLQKSLYDLWEWSVGWGFPKPKKVRAPAFGRRLSTTPVFLALHDNDSSIISELRDFGVFLTGSFTSYAIGQNLIQRRKQRNIPGSIAYRISVSILFACS